MNLQKQVEAIVVDAKGDSVTFPNIVDLMRVIREMAIEIEELRNKVAVHQAFLKRMQP